MHSTAHSFSADLCAQVIHTSTEWIIDQPHPEGIKRDIIIFHDIWFFKSQLLTSCNGKNICTFVHLRVQKKKKNASSHCWREVKKNEASVNWNASERRMKWAKQKAKSLLSENKPSCVRANIMFGGMNHGVWGYFSLQVCVTTVPGSAEAFSEFWLSFQMP